MEVWKDIPGYEGLYQVSTWGNVRTKDDFKLLKLHDLRGYKSITLSKDKTQKSFRVHRLVAIAFIPNLNSYPVINHKDENPSNNHVENLEWCTYSYNNNYGTRNARASKKMKENWRAKGCGDKPDLRKTRYKSKKVAQYDMQGNLIDIYDSIAEAETVTGTCHSSISRATRGLQNYAYGYKWVLVPKDKVNNA